MNEPMAELQFTDEEIDHAVHVLEDLRVRARRNPQGSDAMMPVSEMVRTVLRAVRAVPARCLNGHLAGNPAHRGAQVQGTGVNGVVVRGTVETSYPVTTVVRQPDGRQGYLWTNTIRSWDPSTEALKDAVRRELGMPNVTVELSQDVPLGQVWVLPPEMLRADDDGMAVEVDR